MGFREPNLQKNFFSSPLPPPQVPLEASRGVAASSKYRSFGDQCNKQPNIPSLPAYNIMLKNDLKKSKNVYKLIYPFLRFVLK